MSAGGPGVRGLVLAGLTLLFSATLPSAAGEEWQRPRKLVVAVLNQVTWGDLLADGVDLPTLRRLATHGAVGMMCVRTARPGEAGYLTIGCGARAAAGLGRRAESAEGWAFEVWETIEGAPAGERYRAYTQWPPGSAAIVHLGLGDLARANLGIGYSVRLGLLGGELTRAGLTVGCVGNADTPLGRHREIVAMAMDERGRVKVGQVGGELLTRAPQEPSGVTYHEGRVLSAFSRALRKADVVFLELGETGRVSQYAARMSPEAAAQARRQALARSDRLLGKALSLLPPSGWMAVVVTPTVRPAEPREAFAPLAPVIIGGPAAPRGILTSPSTRRLGMVVNTDLAASILDWFGVAIPSETQGRPLRVVGQADPLAWLADRVRRENGTEQARRLLFRWLPLVAAATLWASALLLLLRERAPRWMRAAARGMLATVLAVPAMAVLAGAYPMSATAMLAVVSAGAVGVALLGGWATLWRQALAPASWLLVALVAVDLVRGQQWLAWSPLSYSPASGARFYGLGNELGGGLLGAALVAVGSALGSRSAGIGRRAVAACGLTGLAVLVGLPRGGSNVGIALACGLGFGTFMLYLWRDEPGRREIVAVGMLVLGLVVAAVAMDLFRVQDEVSHVGMLAASLKAKGWPVLWETVARKVAMNMMLVRNSAWSDAGMAAMATLLVAVAAGRGSGLLVAAYREAEWLRAALAATLVGAGGAFVLNDSGVVAAAMVLGYGVGWLAYVMLGAQQ